MIIEAGCLVAGNQAYPICDKASKILEDARLSEDGDYAITIHHEEIQVFIDRHYAPTEAVLVETPDGVVTFEDLYASTADYPLTLPEIIRYELR